MMRFPFQLAKDSDAKGQPPPTLPKKAVLEVKYDGVRAIWDGPQGRLYSRRDNTQNVRFPEVIPVLPKDAVLDGEVIVFDKNGTSDMHGIMRRGKDPTFNRILAKKEPATFIAFDVLEHHDLDLRDLPLEGRKMVLHQIAGPARAWPSANLAMPRSWDLGEIDAAREWVIKHNEEGLIIKDLDRRYEAKGADEKRTDAWIKWKVWSYDVKPIVRWGLHKELHPEHTDSDKDTLVAIIENGGREQCVAISSPSEKAKLEKNEAKFVIVRYLDQEESGALRFATSRGLTSTLESAATYVKLRME